LLADEFLDPVGRLRRGQRVAPDHARQRRRGPGRRPRANWPKMIAACYRLRAERQKCAVESRWSASRSKFALALPKRCRGKMKDVSKTFAVLSRALVDKRPERRDPGHRQANHRAADKDRRSPVHRSVRPPLTAPHQLAAGAHPETAPLRVLSPCGPSGSIIALHQCRVKGAISSL